MANNVSIQLYRASQSCAFFLQLFWPACTSENLKTRLLYGCVLCSSALQFPVTAAEGWLVCDFVSCGLCTAGYLFIFNLRAKTIGKGTRALDLFLYRCRPISQRFVAESGVITKFSPLRPRETTGSRSLSRRIGTNRKSSPLCERRRSVCAKGNWK
jgi:hypothetical protein